MALKGRKPKPVELCIVEGRKDFVALKNNSAKEFEGDLDSAPDWFTASQKETWDYAIYHAPKGLLKSLDKSMLTTWVVASDLHMTACQAVAKSGMIVKSPDKGIPMQNPYLAIINRQAGIMQKASSELGFSPTSRARVSVDQSGISENPFLNRGKRNEKS